MCSALKGTFGMALQSCQCASIRAPSSVHRAGCKRCTIPPLTVPTFLGSSRAARVDGVLASSVFHPIGAVVGTLLDHRQVGGPDGEAASAGVSTGHVGARVVEEDAARPARAAAAAVAVAVDGEVASLERRLEEVARLTVVLRNGVRPVVLGPLELLSDSGWHVGAVPAVVAAANTNHARLRDGADPSAARVDGADAAVSAASTRDAKHCADVGPAAWLRAQ